MKTNLKYTILALAGLSLYACNSEVEPLPEIQTPVASTYTIAIAGDTKSYIDTDHMTWEAGDQIGWFTDKAGSSEINMDTDPRSFQVSSDAALEAGSVIYAYAPYAEGEQSATAAPLSIPAWQDDVMTDAMPMVSLPVEVSADLTAGAPVAEARFVNLGAVIRYNLYTTDEAYASERVKSVTFTSDSNIAGDFTVDLTAVSADALPEVSGLECNSVTSTLAEAAVVGASVDEGTEVYQVIAPGTWSGTVTIVTDLATYEYTVDGKEFSRNTIKTLNVDLASVNAVRTSFLPAFDQIESLLTAVQWELKAVLEVGNEVESSLGNKVKFNKDHSLAFDCSANGGLTFDHFWEGALIEPYAYYEEVTDPMSWDIWEGDNGEVCLGIWSGYLLVWVQEDIWAGYYRITKLTETSMTVETTASWGDTWTLVFEAAGTVDEPDTTSPDCPYWYEFADGDFGIGPAFDWGGWYDGYYYDMLTTPYVLGGASWAITDAGFFEWAGTEGWQKGIQLGTGGMAISSFKLSSSSFPGEITSVTLGYNSGIADGESLVVSCTVGGEPFGSAVAHSDGDYEAVFTGNASGEIEITLNSAVNGAVYLYYLYIEYNPY